ncbi:hypothetical protein ACFL6T_02980 [Candidatus Zixiibacteriota bacterium]
MAPSIFLVDFDYSPKPMTPYGLVHASFTVQNEETREHRNINIQLESDSPDVTIIEGQHHIISELPPGIGQMMHFQARMQRAIMGEHIIKCKMMISLGGTLNTEFRIIVE